MSYFRSVIFLLLLGTTQLLAQHKITGRVFDETGISLPSATISLKSASDTTKAQHTFSDDNGTFTFNKIVRGEYYLTTSYITYKDVRQIISVDSSPSNVVNIQMLPADNELSEIVIQGQKQSVRTKGGTTKMNVEDNNLAQSQSAYDLLKSLPGVNISKDGDIRIKGKSGVTIMIDGEPVEMGNNQLKSLLKSTPGSTLQTVEVMNTPPASMDASGNAGVINFVFSKKVNKGLNGTLTSGLSRGKYWSTDHGLSLSYGTNKWNFNLLYAFNYDHSWQRDITDRTINIVNHELQIDQLQKGPKKSTGNLLKISIDHYLNSKNTLSLTTSYNHVSDPSKRNSWTTFGKATKSDSLFYQKTDARGNLNNWDGLLRHKIKFAEDKSLNTSIEATYMKHKASEYNKIEKSTVAFPLYLKDEYPSSINRYMLKSDYLQEFTDTSGKKLGKFEIGVKSTYSALNNKQISNKMQYAQWFFDPIKSNTLKYKEAIQAAYVSMEFKIKAWSFRGGLRGEYTSVKADSLNNRNVVKQDYLSLFPNAEISYNYNNLYNISLVYSRRIDRPDYDKLNPTTKMLDLYTYEKGNPRLKPQYADNIELSQQFFSFIDLTAGYSFIRDPMYFSYISTPSLQSYYTTINSKKESQWHVALSSPIPSIDWWENYHSIYIYNSQFNADLGDERFKERATSIGLFSFNSFKLPHSFSIELVGWYEGGGLYSNFRYKPLAEINVGVNKKLMKDKLNIGIAISDAFYTGTFRAHTVSKNEKFSINSKSDSRSIKFTLSWNFGTQPKNKYKEIEDENDKNRISTSSTPFQIKPKHQ